MIEALDADYTRTAYLKGLSPQPVVEQARAAELAPADDRRHRDQVGYLVGGLS